MEREEQEAWELAKQLVQIDSSDPGAYEEEIGLWITDWFKKQITDFGGKLADQIHVSRLEVLPGRYNVMAKIPGKTEGPGLIYICHMDTVMLGDGWDEDISPLGAMVRDGKMYGRGACDMKSGLACALTAFKNMVKKVGERGELPEKPFSMNSIIIGFDTRCSRTQQCLCSEHRCQYDSCIARMITWSRILLFIGIFMFFIHDDQSQTPERQKNRRTYSKYYIIIVIGKLFTPYLYTFSIRKLGVINSQPVTKYPFQTFGDLCSQCYLRQQIQHLLSCLNCLLNKMNIDFSLSAP
jgi:hypothetical protein